MKMRGYRLSVDDNIWFLRDIANHPEYTSLFDNPYLKLYKSIHDKYGTKVHMNIYYETDGFNLTQMPDRFKDEWAANSNWLKLSFHANADSPSWPYLNSSYEEVYNDCKRVQDEILRFAGKEVLGPVTTLHFAEATKDGVKALRDCGIKVLLGDFAFDKNGDPYLDYYCTREQFDKVRENCFYKDPETDMIFACCDVVLNTFKVGEIAPEMDRYEREYPGRDFVDILIHEQYFYPDFRLYLPEYGKLIEEGVEWCISRNYEPAFITDVIDPDTFE